ncbi:uncharacterized protein LOC126809611 [Patella vulgata]|uniref:uncharacterized protein LOC126809611 n=1 Tax=Patella vulgata TaxID=6465 RepID=UPI0024A9BB23|nr:uncharacterized protein LOC126809611 [Patella vulgata]
MANPNIFTLLVCLGIGKGLFVSSSEIPITTSLQYYEDVTPLFSVNETRAGSYVDLGSYPHWCLGNITDCQNGLSVALWTKALPATASTKNRILITNGGHVENGEGFYIMQEYGYQYIVVVNSGTSVWKGSFFLKPGVWIQVAFSWSETPGLKLFTDGFEQLSVTSPEVRELGMSDYQESSDIYVGLDEYGKPFDSSESFYVRDVTIHNTAAKIDELTKTLDKRKAKYAFYNIYSADDYNRTCELHEGDGIIKPFPSTMSPFHKNIAVKIYRNPGQYNVSAICTNIYGNTTDSKLFLARDFNVKSVYQDQSKDYIIKVDGIDAFKTAMTVELNQTQANFELNADGVKVLASGLIPGSDNLLTLAAGDVRLSTTILRAEKHLPYPAITCNTTRGEWNMNVEFTFEIPAGDHIIATIDYGLGESEKEFYYVLDAPTTRYINTTKSFTELGFFTVTLTVNNDISSRSWLKSLSVEIPITSVSVTASNVTSLSQPVVFNVDVNSGERGPVDVDIEIDFDDGTAPVILKHHNTDNTGFSTFQYSYTYSNWGIYDVKVRVFNNITSVFGNIILQAGENITFLDVTTEAERISTNSDVSFSITCPTGSDITYDMTFGDGTTFTLQESSTNPTSNSHTTAQLESDNTVTMTHTYFTPGYYTVNVTAENVFGTATTTLCPTVVVDSTETTDPPVCSITMVTFRDMNSSLTSPFNVKRSEDTLITVDEEMSCKINATSNFSWKASKMVLDGGTQSEETVHEICLFQEKNNTLLIPALALSYGLYKITVTVAPTDHDLISYSKTLYLQVVMSNPVAVMEGGEVQSFLVYATAIFDISNSRDPDLQTDWRRKLSYHMFCMPEYKLASVEDKSLKELQTLGSKIGNKTMYRTATKNDINFYQIETCFNNTGSLMEDLAVYNGKVTFAANHFLGNFFSFGFMLFVSREGLVSGTKQIVEVRKSNASLDDLSSLLDIALNADPDTAIRLLDGAASSILNASPTSVDDQEKLASSTEAVVGTLGSVAKRVDNSNQATKCAKTFGTMTSNKALVNEESRSKAAQGLGDLANGTANMGDATVDDASNFAGACLGGFDNIFPAVPVETVKRSRRSAGQAPPASFDTTMSPLDFTTSSYFNDQPEETVQELSMAPCDVAGRLLDKLPELNTYDELLYFICDDCALFRKIMRSQTVQSECPCVDVDDINAMQCSGDFTLQDKIFAVMTYLEHPGDLYQYYVKPLLEAKAQRDEERRLTDGKVSKAGSDALMTVAGTVNDKAPKEDTSTRSFQSNRLGLKVQKINSNKNGTANESGSQSMEMPTGAFNLPLGILTGAADCENVNTMFLGDNDNPYTFSKEKANVGKGVLSLGYSCNGEKVIVQDTDEPIELWMNRDSDAYVAGTFVLLTRWGEDKISFNYHPVNLTDRNASLQVVLKPGASTESFYVYVSYDIRPNETHYDFMDTVPKTDISHLGEILDPLAVEELLYTVTIPPELTSENGTYWIGVKLKRGTVSLTGELSNHTYSLLNLISGCRYWDEDNERWSSEGCNVGPQTTKYKTQCFCNHLTSFGSDFVVPVNTIDFTNVWAKFNNLSENAAVFSTVITILCLYLISLIWARHMDKKDLLKWGAMPLADNLPTDNYHYQIAVQTGMRKNAGTESKVSFILSGDDADTGVRRLWDEKRKRLPRGTIFNYVLSVEGPLGAPTFLRIWHDNTGIGKSRSWYLDQVQLTDLQTGEKFFFLCDRWLAVEEDDGMVDRIIPVAGINDLIAFKQLFSSSARKKLANEHLWVSVFSRPTRSNFTRVQRISCCMALLFLTMITNCMFFKAEDNVQHVTALTLGPFQFTLQQVYISVVSTLIVFPVSFILVTFFRRCRPKKNTIMQNHQQVKRNKFKWKNINNQSAVWGAQAKRSRLAKLKDSLNNILSFHQKSKYETDTATLRSATPTERKKKRKKEPFTLPHWCLYIGWVLCFFSVAGSAFFTILYSMEWGNEKSTDWLITFLMSFFQSVIIIQPIKVLLIVAFLACILKKPDLDEEDVGEDFDTIIHPDEETVKKKDVDVHALLMQRKLANSDYRPPDLSELEETRQLRLNEIKMEAVVKDIVVYAFFVLIIFFLSYQQRDSEGFYLADNLKNRFATGFDKISTVQNYWSWLESQFMPNYYATQYFNNTNIINWQDRNCISDLETRRVGVTRLRQLRIKEDSCEIRGIFKGYINHCRSPYGWVDDDTKDYFTKWMKPVGINVSLLEDEKNPWVYQNSLQLKNAPYVATIASYKGGGYVALTKRQLCRTRKVIEDIKHNDWLDTKTRAVFLEFTLYNPNSNLFASVVMVAEFMAVGGVTTRTEFKVFRLLSYIGAWGVVIVLFEVIYACFTFYFFIQCIKKLKKEKMKYFKRFWNLLEFILLVFAVTVIAMYAFKHILTNLAINALHDRESDGFVNFQSVALYDETYGYMMSVVVFLATIQFLKLLQFNQRMSMLGDTIKLATKDLKVFSIAFLIYFFTFTFTAYLLFGQAMVSYNSLIGAAESMFAFALGSFDFEGMADAQRIIGPIFFFMFIGVIYIGMMSIFLTIIGDAFTRVKEDVTLRSNEYEIVDFVWKRFKALLGLT